MEAVAEAALAEADDLEAPVAAAAADVTILLEEPAVEAAAEDLAELTEAEALPETLAVVAPEEL